MNAGNMSDGKTLSVRRALVSVSDKSGVVDFVQSLQKEFSVEILSTGGTAKALREAGVTVKDVSEHTAAPEIFGGRVKTLHPKVHGGILYRRDHAGDEAERAENHIEPIDLLIVNLYPFRETVAREADFAECVENIDIGGPAMLRAAAKNHKDVVILTAPDDYALILKELREKGGVSAKTRLELAAKAFYLTAAYDAAVGERLCQEAGINPTALKHIAVGGVKAIDLRYGENPHQAAGFYKTDSLHTGAATARLIQGKPLSYNNIADADAAFEAVCEFGVEKPACVIVKHANPCGAATRGTLKAAYAAALRCDPVSAFGGIVAFNQNLDAETAREVTEIFTEVIIAPDASPEARTIIAEKKNLRLLLTGGVLEKRKNALNFRAVGGGFLLQEADLKSVTREELRVVTERKPSDKELADLLFAFNVAKHVKSNAIVYAKDLATVGIGAGQMNRLDSSRIAVMKSAEIALREDLDHSLSAGSVVASDAFFPFADGMLAAADAGVTAVIQPGGAMRDEEVIEAANERKLAMIFTGVRHFRH